MQENPRRRRGRSTAAGPFAAQVALGISLALDSAACTGPDHAGADAGPTAAAERTIEVAPRTPHLSTYPCGPSCHEARTADPTPRELREFHAGRRTRHGPAIGWCGSCHALDDVEALVLLDGTTHVSFDASSELCAQCHGPEHADWEVGVHGLSTGGWRGTVRRRACTACHDPHEPGAIHLEALPAPHDERDGALGADEDTR